MRMPDSTEPIDSEPEKPEPVQSEIPDVSDADLPELTETMAEIAAAEPQQPL